MNLLLVHNHYRLPGGEDTVVSNEYKLLKSMGHSVTLYERHNDEIAGLTGFQRLALPFNFIYSKKTAKEITAIIKEKHIDAVLVHNTLSLISPSVYYAAEKAGIPVLQTIHNFRLICPKATLFRDGHVCEDCIKKGLHCAVLHKCYRGSFTQTLLCVISSKIHRKKGIYNRLNYICLTEFNRDKLLTLSGINKDRIYIKPNFTAARETFIPYKDRENTFVYAGRLEEQKGTKELLDAWFILETKAKDPENIPALDLYGTGPETDYARKYIEKHGLRRVNLHDPLPHEDIIKTIGSSKALILPTKWYEGFPMTIAEAFGTGTPVIGTDLGNTGDLIKNTAAEPAKNTAGGTTAEHTRSADSARFTPLGALIDPADMEASLAGIIEAWDNFTYDTAAFQKAAQRYGEEENRRIFTKILTEITGKRKTLLIVTNIPSPYRVDFFHYLQTTMTDYDIHIMFQSGNERSFRTWSGGEEKLKNTHFLKSKVIQKTGFDQTEKFIPKGTTKTLNEIRPDIVVCMEYNPCAIMVKHWCNKNRVPYISWTDGTRLSEAHIGLLQKLSRKYIIKGTKAFIASSTAARDNQIYLGADPEKIHISYLTVDIEKYRLDRPERTPENKTFNLLFVGRVVKLKGLELLLPIIKTLSGNVRLIIAGDGPELPEIRKLAEELEITDRIESAGYVEGEALKNCYRKADAFILPTKNDCYGLVILEAMCAGLPVISSKYADGARDLIEEGVTGFIVDPYDEKQFSETIETLMNNPLKAAEMGKAGLERSKEFSFEKVSKGFIEAVHGAQS